MENKENKHLITLCPFFEDPTRENLVNIYLNTTEKVLTTPYSDLDLSRAEEKYISEISFYSDYIIYKSGLYRVLHAIIVTDKIFSEKNLHRYPTLYKKEKK